MNRSALVVPLVLAMSTAGLACGSGDLCTAEDLQAALDAAGDAAGGGGGGSVVVAAECAPMGPLVVPAGVTLSSGPGARVVAPADGVAVVLDSGANAAALREITVQADGRIGVLVRGTGAASIDGVAISATRGVALAAQGATDLAVTDVQITGPVDTSNANDSRFLRVVPAPPPAGACPAGTTCDCTPGDVETGTGRACDAAGHWAEVTATYGVYFESTTASLANVDVRGFAQFGAVFRECDVTWDGGSVRDTLGVGVRQLGGDATLTGVEVATTLQGVRGAPVYGFAATDGARVTGMALDVSDNDRYGFLLLDGSASLTDLAAARNGDAAVWVAGSDDFVMEGMATTVADNAFAGVVVAESMNVTIRDATVSGTTESMRAVGTLGARRVGDGLHVIETTSALELDAVTLRGNERVGALFDLGTAGMGEGFTFVDVTVEGDLGAIAGRLDPDGQLTPVAPGTWDAGITRLGAALAADAAFSGVLDALIDHPDAPGVDERVGVIAPMF